MDHAVHMSFITHHRGRSSSSASRKTDTPTRTRARGYGVRTHKHAHKRLLHAIPAASYAEACGTTRHRRIGSVRRKTTVVSARRRGGGRHTEEDHAMGQSAHATAVVRYFTSVVIRIRGPRPQPIAAGCKIPCSCIGRRTRGCAGYTAYKTTARHCSSWRDGHVRSSSPGHPAERAEWSHSLLPSCGSFLAQPRQDAACPYPLYVGCWDGTC